MQLSQVLAILNKTVKLHPQVTETLQRWRDVYYGISLHTTGACPRFRDAASGRLVTPAGFFGNEYQYLFDNYLLNRHPRESDATRNWRYSQYRPLTKAPFGQITEIVTGAIFQDSNYMLEVQDKEDDAYVWGNHFSGYDIAGYFSNIGFRNMVEDPNGVFLRIPAAPCTQQSSSKVAVDIWFVNTKDMVLFTPTDLVFKHDGYAWWVNEQTIWRFAYKADKKQYYLAADDADGYYAHMLGRLPITIAGGEWNTQGYYDSYFSKAKAAADDFVSAYSAAQLVDKEASHPFIVEASTDCSDCSGQGHIQKACTDCPGGVELATCNTCSGSGQVSRNPGQHIIIPHDKLKDGTPLQIINPDVSINSHHRDVCAQIMQLMTDALHLNKTSEAQSGVAKAIDQERLYKFISTIANHVFDKILHDTLRDIIAYRNVVNIDGQVHPATFPFRLVKPTQFRIKTSTDLLTEYNEGTRAGMPVFIRQRMAMDFVDKQYSGDELMKKKAQVVAELDTLSVLSTSEILDLRAATAITNEEMIYSRKLPQVLDAMIREKGSHWFLQADVETIKNEAENYLEEKVDASYLHRNLLN
jgi:hypothetical protein